MRHERGRDGRHTGGENGRVGAALPECQTIFQDFLIRTVESTVNQPFRAARPFARDPFEKTFAVGSGYENNC